MSVLRMPLIKGVIWQPKQGGVSIRKLLLALISVFSLALPADAKTYYVSPSGNDAYSGSSPSTPWRSIAKINASVFYGGDSVLFEGGKIFDGNLRVSDNFVGGSASSPITISSYGTGRAILQSNTAQILVIEDVGGISVQNISFVGSGHGAVGVYNHSTSTRLDHLKFTNLDMSGVSNGFDIEALGPNAAVGFSNLLIDKTNIHDMTGGGPGIYVSGNTTTAYAHTNFTIRRIQVSGYGSDGINIGGVDGLLLERSVVHDGGAGGGSTEAIQLNYDNKATVQFNETYHQAAPIDHYDGGGIDVDMSVTNTTVQYNWSHDNAGPGISLFQGTGIPWANVTVRYNITQNNGTGPTNLPCEIVIGSVGQNGITGLNIYGNTFYTSVGGANVNSVVRFEAASSSGIMANNIFYIGGSKPRIVNSQKLKPTSMRFLGNHYYTAGVFKIYWGGTTYSSLKAWRHEALGRLRPLSRRWPHRARYQHRRALHPGAM